MQGAGCRVQGAGCGVWGVGVYLVGLELGGGKGAPDVVKVARRLKVRN